MALDGPKERAVASPPDHELIAETLLVPFEVIVLDVFADDPPQMAFARRVHPGHAF